MEKKNNKTQFINFNGNITPKPNGVDYSLIPGKVYTMTHLREECLEVLQEDRDFELPFI